MPIVIRLAKYCWAAPWSLLGAVLGCVAILLGADWRRAQGTFEIGGGLLGALIRRLPPSLSFSAITFGHVILGVDLPTLAHLRAHEQVHVRQYEHWGPAYVPAYILSSLLQLMRGRHPYLDNHFEREAYAVSHPRAPQT
ncbi:MAG TPA: signal peptide prediction [Ramlibacter sp.]|uniref:signal peptide prediction n=1 Tax=Ramlibacter sp. TaxID=1917967 RepID=UPI002BAAB5A5|nr:signal peptide prediction [Ramlibacter sp.]HVZ44325.1 signal peptide prediction [Ramlibacter sp.]